MGGHLVAGATPLRPEIDDGQLFAAQDEVVEVSVGYVCESEALLAVVGKSSFFAFRPVILKKVSPNITLHQESGVALPVLNSRQGIPNEKLVFVANFTSLKLLQKIDPWSHPYFLAELPGLFRQTLKVVSIHLSPLQRLTVGELQSASYRRHQDQRRLVGGCSENEELLFPAISKPTG